MTSEMYTKINDHIDEAKDRSVWQYKGKPNWDAGREIYAQRIQILEDIIWKMLVERGLSSADGVQLDLYASDYNLERFPSESDEDFRVRIQVEINLLRSAGQVPVLNFNLSRLVAPRKISLKQVFPLKILMWIFVDDFDELPPDDLARINSTMQTVKAAGVGLEIGLQLNDIGFQFSAIASNGTLGRGFATTLGGDDGGAFAKNI